MQIPGKGDFKDARIKFWVLLDAFSHNIIVQLCKSIVLMNLLLFLKAQQQENKFFQNWMVVYLVTYRLKRL